MRRNVRGAKFQDIRIKKRSGSVNKFRIQIKTTEKITSYPVMLANTEYEEIDHQSAQEKYAVYRLRLDEEENRLR